MTNRPDEAIETLEGWDYGDTMRESHARDLLTYIACLEFANKDHCARITSMAKANGQLVAALESRAEREEKDYDSFVAGWMAGGGTGDGYYIEPAWRKFAGIKRVIEEAE